MPERCTSRFDIGSLVTLSNWRGDVFLGVRVLYFYMLKRDRMGLFQECLSQGRTTLKATFPYLHPPAWCQLPQLSTWILRSFRLQSRNYSEAGLGSKGIARMFSGTSQVASAQDSAIPPHHNPVLPATGRTSVLIFAKGCPGAQG